MGNLLNLSYLKLDVNALIYVIQVRLLGNSDNITKYLVEKRNLKFSSQVMSRNVLVTKS